MSRGGLWRSRPPFNVPRIRYPNRVMHFASVRVVLMLPAIAHAQLTRHRADTRMRAAISPVTSFPLMQLELQFAGHCRTPVTIAGASGRLHRLLHAI